MAETEDLMWRRPGSYFSPGPVIERVLVHIDSKTFAKRNGGQVSGTHGASRYFREGQGK
jgi:hypothetical protein